MLLDPNAPKPDLSWANQDTPEQIAKTQADRAAVAAYEQQAAAAAPTQEVNTAGSFGAAPAPSGIMAPPPAPSAPSVPVFGAPPPAPAPAGSGMMAPAPAPSGGAVFGAPSPPGAAPAAPAMPPVPSAAPIGQPVAGAPPAQAAQAAPAQTPQWLANMGAMDWGAGANASTKAVWDAMRANGGTLEQVAAYYGFTPAQIQQHFTSRGYNDATGTVDTPAKPGSPITSEMDFDTETIQGRMGQLLRTDAQGNYLDPVVRQAADRQLQAFAGRGLLNSSAAMQAAQEAAISKAIEITGPDAQRYFENRHKNMQTVNDFLMSDKQYSQKQGLMDKEQALKDNTRGDEEAFTTRNNYVAASDRTMERFNRTIDQINASNMTPDDKSVAIRQATAVRDADLTYFNNMYAKMPGWKQEWLTIATPTMGMDLTQVTNIDTLANIANDPAQPPELREQAKARMAQLQSAQSTPAPTPAPAPGGMMTDALPY